MKEYHFAPITGRQAIAWVNETHRHLPKLQGALFAVSVEWLGVRVGVATVGNPPRKWQGTGRVIISRCAALPDLAPVIDRRGKEHSAPVCSMLYGRCAEIARLMSYKEIWTYSLSEEDGRSIKAAGFEFMGWSPDSSNWAVSRTGRQQAERGRKGRWRRLL